MIQVPDIIKEYLHYDTCQKNIRIHFPNGERSDICNDLIVKDTVSFTESLCSQDTLKFGLCEAPVFECETVGVGNIKGATIQVFCEIYCEADYANIPGAIWQSDLMSHVYQIPLGTFVVASCQRQGDIIHRKIVAYGFTYVLENSGISKNAYIKFKASEFSSRSGPLRSTIEGIVYSSYPSLFNKGNYTYSTAVYDGSQGSAGVRIATGVGTVIWHNMEISCRWYLKPRWIGLAGDDGSGTVVEIDTNKMDINRDFLSDIVRVFDDYDEAFSDSPDRWGYPYGRPGRQWAEECLAADLNGEPWLYVQYYGQDSESEKMQGKMIMEMCEVPDAWGVVSGAIMFGGYTLEVVRETAPDVVLFSEDAETINIGSDLSYSITKNNFNGYSWPLAKIETKYNNQTRYTASESFDEMDILGYFNALLETEGLFMRSSRYNYADMISIKQQFALLPSNTLYPSSSLYPGSPTGASIRREDYQSCWYDDNYTKPFGAVQCQFKDSNNNDILFFLFLDGFDETTPTDSYQIYDLSGNLIIESTTWTEAQIQAICEQVATNIDGVTYMPVSFTGRGLPYVEAGDTFEILTKANESITTIVLNRTLTGDQTLTDSYKSTGTDTGIY